MNEFIRQCPFCAGYAEPEEHRECIGHGEYIIYSFVKCQRCGATSHPITDREIENSDERKNQSIKEWNFRYKDEIDRQRKIVLMSFYGTMGDKVRKEITQDIKRFNNIVEVVRCKDCQYLEITGCYGECVKLVRIVRPWDFCSYGARREE